MDDRFYDETLALTPQELLERLNPSPSENDATLQNKVDMIVFYIDNAEFVEARERINQLLGLFPKPDVVYDPSILVAFLIASVHFRGMFSNRDAMVGRIWERLVQMKGYDKAKRLLRNRWENTDFSV